MAEEELVPKPCKYCKREFTPTRWWQNFCDKDGKGTCRTKWHAEAAESEKAKKDGKRQVAENAQIFMETMRSAARMMARQMGEITIDDLRRYARENDIEPHHKNAWGAVIQNNEFKAVGYTNSTIKQSRGRTIRIWRLRA